MRLLALLSSSRILLTLSLSITLLNPLEESEVVFPKGLDDGLKTDLSFAFRGGLLCEVESREGFDGRLGHGWKVSLTNDRNNMTWEILEFNQAKTILPWTILKQPIRIQAEGGRAKDRSVHFERMMWIYYFLYNYWFALDGGTKRLWVVHWEAQGGRIAEVGLS